MIFSLSFRAKLIAIFLLAGSLPLAWMWWRTLQQAETMFMATAEKSLLASLQLKKNHVENYFQMIEDQLRELVSRPFFIQGVVEMHEAFHEPNIVEDKLLRQRVQEQFNASFVKEFQNVNQGKIPVGDFVQQLDDTALFWQERYVWQNRYPFQERGLLDSGGDLDYDKYHARHHPTLRIFEKRLDFQDVHLVDFKTGHVFYSVRKEIDFATSLIDGPFAKTGFGKVVRHALQTDQDVVNASDYAPYFPNYDQLSAFLALPVLHEGKRLAILVVQFDNNRLDRIMQERFGLGQTGETFLAGRTSLGIELRSNRTGDNGRIGQPVVEPFFVNAMTHKTPAGSSSLSVEGKNLLAFVPMTIHGLEWGVAGTLSKDEAMAPVLEFEQNLLIATLITLLALSLSALYFGGVLLLPLQRLSKTALNIANGHWSARITEISNDEFGAMGETFNRMAERVEQQYWVKEKLAQLAGVLQSAQNKDALSLALVRELIALLDAAHGTLYLLDDTTGHYVVKTGYRLADEMSDFAPGEGLVGRCALEAQGIFLEGVPAQELRIDIGLGLVAPVSVLAYPLKYHERTMGVIVLVLFHPISPVQCQLLEELSLLGGVALDNLERIHHIEELLEETRNQAIELEISQQELEQMNQELEEQTQLVTSHNNQLEQAHIELKRTSRYKSEFLASMSHELRTPLNSILILAKEFCKNEEKNLVAEQVESAEVIYQSGKELLELINEILDLSRIEAGQVEITHEEMLLEQFCEEIRRQFAPQAKEKGLHWQVTLDADLTTSCRVDWEKMRRIVKNLVVNAFKFTQQGEVMVRMGLADQALVITVADTGCGIAQKDQKTIFDAFCQIKREDGVKQGGVGLGLAISSKLAGLIGGTIHLESAPGRGSIFTLRVPCEPIVHTVETKREFPDDRLPESTRKLLLVEDHAPMRRSVIELIQDQDVTVIEAASGAEALACFGTHHFDCMILDLGLPDMDGSQLLEQMAAVRPLPPVIIHSARDLTREEHDRLQGYTDSIVVKRSQMELRLRDEILLFLHRVIRDTPKLSNDSMTIIHHRDEFFTGKTVLLVDDDVRNVFAMTRNLEKKGLRVVMAGNGAEAIQLLEKGQAVDCVLMDIMMPIMDGHDAMRALRAREPFRKLPILALTAKAMPEDKMRCLEAGANDYLTKPVDMDRLFEMMRIWMQRHWCS
ncbi:MAG: response regulator [Magnetococcus sp. YQC-5]